MTANTNGAAAPGLGGFSMSVRLMGACFYVAWIEVIYSSQAFIASERFGQDAAAAIFPISTLGLAVGLALMALRPALTGRLFKTRWSTYGAGALGALCTLLACIPGYLPAAWCFYACAFGTGFCTAAIAMRCATVMVDMDSRTAITALAAVQFVAILILSFALTMAAYVGPVGSIAVLCLLLPLSAVLLELDDGRGAQGWCHDGLGSALPQGFWRVVGAMAVLGLGTCSVRGFFPNFMSGEEFTVALWATACVALVVMGAIMAWVNTVVRGAPYGAICYRMLLVVTVVAALLLVTGLDSMVAGVIATVLFMVTLLISWAVLFRVSFKTGASVVAVFGFGFAAVAAGCDAGFVLGHRLALSGFEPWAMTAASVGAVLVCLAVALVLLRAADFEALMEPVSVDEELFAPVAVPEPGTAPQKGGAVQPAGSGEPPAPFKRRCDRIALEHGLSARETEVLYLMAKGNDARAIAEGLFVSYNTARTHIRNIYGKLEVHSRHEFFDVVNGERR